MMIVVLDSPGRVIGSGAGRATIKNTGSTVVYFARTADAATAAAGLPLSPGEGLWIDGPLWAACGEADLGELRVILPG